MVDIDLRLGHFMPALLVPISSYPAVIGGVFLLLVSVLTHISTRSPSRQMSLSLLRLSMAPPAVMLFWKFGYDTSYNPPGAQVAVGMAVVGLYGIMRTIDANITTSIGMDVPVWVQRSNGKSIPIPTDTKGRLMYTLDVVTSLRGTSWFSDRYWNWAPTPLVRSPTADLDRRTFLKRSVRSLVLQYLTIDVLDSINKSRTWDPANRFPITSLSAPEQLLFALSVCIGTVFPITVMHTLVSGVAVALGSAPVSWPPMFNRPFHSTSLADFWSKRWHAIFRHSFTRLYTLVSIFSPLPQRYNSRIRPFVIFALSATLHVMLMYRLELSKPSHPSLLQTFLDPSILAFFLVQPLGLAIEALVVQPFTKRLCSGGKMRRSVMRVWAWGFMLWSGRYWSDVWVKRGMWNETEHVVGYSLVRWLLKGQWKA